jgi:hypothetical protein
MISGVLLTIVGPFDVNGAPGKAASKGSQDDVISFF